jgi:N-acyl-D-aspartate/D-glutamate deacylase
MIPAEPCARSIFALIAVGALLAGCTTPDSYDVILRGGTVYDGGGGQPYVGDIALRGDMIEVLGDLGPATAAIEIDVGGLAVAPGFVNMMCWSNESLIEDGRSQSDIRQGVTLEILGEGESMGPLNDAMKQVMVERQGDIRYDIEWTTLGEYLEFLERRGVTPNVASFIGTGNPRDYVIGQEDRAPTAEELERMRDLVREAMEEGALGVASALIYPPGSFAETEELIALAEVAAEYGGMYISHMRSEGAKMLEAIEELLTIAREAEIRAEIYHLKSSGEANWPLSGRRVADHCRHLHLPGQRHRAQRQYPAVGPGGRFRGLTRAHEGPRATSADRPRDARRVGRVGEQLSGRWLARAYSAGGVQDRAAQTADRQDTRRGGADARYRPPGDGHGPDRRGRQPSGRGLFQSVRGDRAPGDRPTVGELQLG